MVRQITYMKVSYNERNHSLNVLEGIACFSVVMLHCGFPGVVGKVIYGIARFAVLPFYIVGQDRFGLYCLALLYMAYGAK